MNDFALLDKPLTVSEINKLVKNTLEDSFYNLALIGEVSSFSPSGNGHWYFTIKDNASEIRAVMFRSHQYKVNEGLKNGDKIIAKGSLSVYEPRGTYSFNCLSIEKEGKGNILLELEKRKAYYNEKGYFDRKREIPKYPKTVGVVTASTGAAIQDILQITERRAPSMNIVVLPSLVQGATAAIDIALRIRQANMYNLCDVLIVGRGGGSMEDLLCFSEPAVIEAIYESDIPVISAVGHEIDWAISDFVADLRASTPSAAAELVTENYNNQVSLLKETDNNLKIAMKSIVYKAESKIVRQDYLNRLIQNKVNVRIPSISDLSTFLDKKLISSEFKLNLATDRQIDILNNKVLEKFRKIDDENRNIFSTFERKYNERESRVNRLSAEIEALNPLSILKRGYAVVEKKDKKIVKQRSDIKNNEELNIRLYKDNITVVVKGE